MNNTITIKITKNIKNIVSTIAIDKEVSLSSIFREVLKEYPKQEQYYSEDLYYGKYLCVKILEKEDFLKKDYQTVADKISERDTLEILKKLYNIA